jgi:hypothetical protein
VQPPGDGTLNVTLEGAAWASRSIQGESELAKQGHPLFLRVSTPASPTAVQLRNAMLNAVLAAANGAGIYLHLIILGTERFDPVALGLSQTVPAP